MSHDRHREDLPGPSGLLALLEIDFEEIGPVRVSGSVAADERHHQPWGLVHGGLYTTAIETFATAGAYEAVKDRGLRPVGITNGIGIPGAGRYGPVDCAVL